VINAPLTAVGNATSSNGVYMYSSVNAFPSATYNANNYWVDVLFALAPPPPTAPPLNVTASPASGQALVSWTPPSASGSATITGYTITPYVGTTAQTPVPISSATAISAVVSGLTDGTSYTFTVAAVESTGTSPASSASAAVIPEDTIFDFSGTPGIVDSGDPSSVDLGVKFTASAAGSVTGIRFHKAATNTGTHIGSLWSASGTLLASATFTNETPSGWQTVLFSSPVAVTPNTTYVASYLAPNGHYSVTAQGLATSVINGPLTAVGNATSSNGVYMYSSGNAFPSSTYNANNYWVDVLFAPASTG
jgi:hypothetical protein